MRAMISRKRCKSRGARNIRRRHPGNFQNFLGWTQRLQARQSTCICFDFKSLRLRSRALQSLPSAAIMSSNALENGVPNEEIWWKWWLPHILPGSSWFFPPVPGSPACACQQWLVVSASWLQSANRSQESRHRRWVPSCTKPGKDLHHSKGLDILIDKLNSWITNSRITGFKSFLPGSSEGSQTPPTSSLCTWPCTLQRPARTMRGRGMWKSGTRQRILEGWNALKENYRIYVT